MRSPRILFVVNEAAHYSEYKKILLDSKIKSSIEPIILFERDGYDITKLFAHEIEDCQKLGFNYQTLPTLHISKSRFFGRSAFFFKRPAFKYIPLTKSFSSLFLFFQNTLDHIAQLKNKLHKIESLIEKNDIDIIILGEENILLDTFIYKKAARKKPVYIYPYTIPNPMEMAGGAAFSCSSLSLKGRLLRSLTGRFTRNFNEKNYLLIHPHKILAFLCMGYLPKNPWVLNDDTADLVFLESQKMAQLYMKLGSEKNRLAVIGSFNDDILYRVFVEKDSAQAQLEQKYHLTHKPIVLVAFPPDQFPRAEAEYLTYSELIQAFAKALLPYLKNYNIVISKHPRIKASLDFMKNQGFVIADESTIQLVPMAHLYIASASATIRWAIASSIPVINYDLYRYHYEDYQDSSAVINIESLALFEQKLDETLNHPQFHHELSIQQKKVASEWGLIDGQFTERFLNILNNKKTSIHVRSN